MTTSDAEIQKLAESGEPGLQRIAEAEELKKKEMSSGKKFWHFISGKDGRSGQVYGKNGSQSGMSHRQMEGYLSRRARKSTRPSEETILASVLSIIFSNTKIEETRKVKGQLVKEVVKSGNISSGLR